MIRVIVNGANGKMGREVVRAISKSGNIDLVGAVDTYLDDSYLRIKEGIGGSEVVFENNLVEAIINHNPDVAVDFTDPHSVYSNTLTILNHGVRPVIGTTGMSQEQIKEIINLSEELRLGGLIAPNFAVGALLMIKFAAEAAHYFSHVEIIELHHEKKLDAPSGTAIKTAESIIDQMGLDFSQGCPSTRFEQQLPGSRGAEVEGIRIHSIRLPGLVAHQEVIFGGLGQTLTIRHDAINRESFMPGVLLAVKKVMELEKVIYGLDKLLF